MSSGNLVQRALDASDEQTALGHERFEVEGATFVRNTKIPQKYYANHVERVTASSPDEIDRLIDRVNIEFEASSHRCFYVDRTTPPEFEAWLVLEGYERTDELVMLLTGDLLGIPNPYEIRHVQSDDEWHAYLGLVEVLEREDAPPEGRRTAAQQEKFLATKQATCPPVRYWMAYLDGQPRAFFSSWTSSDGVGVVDDLFTHPDYRHRGLATTLIHHSISDCRDQGAGPVVIVADASDTPKNMYAAMGFRPIAVTSQYVKDDD
jgi:GNAT superfamily N-acetyltransferase